MSRDVVGAQSAGAGFGGAGFGGSRGAVVGVAAVGVVVVAIAVATPDPVVLGALRLAALAVAVTGAALLVARGGAADLATAAAAGAGAYAGGVGAALLALPVVAGVPAAVLAGAAVGGVTGALHGRIGRALGALTSLAIGGAAVAVLGTWSTGGGVAGFHAVGLPTPFGDRADLIAVGAVLVLALLAGRWLAGARVAAAAAVAVHAPAVAASLGRRPSADGARLGAVAGALLGVGGVTLAAVDGSVLPDAYGLGLAAALGLAALLGGAPPFGPIVGTLVVWGPSTLWPLVPLVGGAPPLLVMGPVGLLMLALRRGRPLLPGPAPHAGVDGSRAASPEWAWPASPDTAAPASAASGTAADGEAIPLAPRHRATVKLSASATPAGPVDLTVAPGEVVALVGPNGAGKSTLLARVGGQLPDGGTVDLAFDRGTDAPGAHPLPRSATARARLGIARTWQRPPRLSTADAATLVVTTSAASAAARWAARVLAAPSDHPGAAQLIRLAAVGPAVALLDEPADLDAAAVLTFVRGLAAAGTAVLVVDHRPEIAAGADRVVTLTPPGAAPPEDASRSVADPSSADTSPRDAGPSHAPPPDASRPDGPPPDDGSSP